MWQEWEWKFQNQRLVNLCQKGYKLQNAVFASIELNLALAEAFSY